jgi:serine/threonine-protein kinase
VEAIRGGVPSGDDRRRPRAPGFEVGALLGRGAYGEVWSAVRVIDGAEVALKVLRGQPGEEARLRFRREAEAAGAVDSARVPRVLESDMLGATPFIAYERLEGETLEARLERDGDLPLADVLPLTDDLLDALEAAHAESIIHRDVKPSNVFLEQVGGELRARLLDFGVAKRSAADDAMPLRTSTGKTLGSLAYMAPEQAGAAGSVDARADLYGLGAIVFRALAGRPPFSGGSPAAVLALKLDRDAPPLSSVTGVDWPKAVEGWLARLLARDPARRFASATAAREALEVLCERVGVTRRSAG